MKSSFPHSKCSIEESFNGHKQLHNYFRSNTCTTTSGQTNAQLLPIKQLSKIVSHIGALHGTKI